MRWLESLELHDRGRVFEVSVDDIDWIEAADYYVQLHTGATSYLHRESMQSLAARLDPERFVRVHRSAIVNRLRVREIRNPGPRETVCVLSTGAIVKVSRSQREKIQRLLSDPA